MVSSLLFQKEFVSLSFQPQVHSFCYQNCLFVSLDFPLHFQPSRLFPENRFPSLFLLIKKKKKFKSRNKENKEITCCFFLCGLFAFLPFWSLFWLVHRFCYGVFDMLRFDVSSGNSWFLLKKVVIFLETHTLKN